MRKLAAYNINMSEELKPRRMGVTRKMRKLPSEKLQDKALDEAGCFPVFEWHEFEQAIVSFLDEDIVVAVDQRVFGNEKWHFRTEVLGTELSVPKAKPGPRPKLEKATPDQWFAINWVYTHTKPKENNAVALAKAFGIDADRHAIRHRSNTEAKADMLKKKGD